MFSGVNCSRSTCSPNVCLFCYLRVTCTGSSSCRFCCCPVTVGGGVSTDVWPQLSDTPGGLTDSRGGLNGASPPTSQKDALLSSKASKPSAPSGPSTLGQKEMGKVSKEELSPPPQKAVPKEPPQEAVPKQQSKPETPKQKKDPVGETCKVRLSIRPHQCPPSHCPDHVLPLLIPHCWF